MLAYNCNIVVTNSGDCNPEWDVGIFKAYFFDGIVLEIGLYGAITIIPYDNYALCYSEEACACKLISKWGMHRGININAPYTVAFWPGESVIIKIEDEHSLSAEWL